MTRSKISWSPLLAPTSNYKVIKFHLKSVCDYKFDALTIQAHPHIPLPKHILCFLTVRGRSKENLSNFGITQENIELTPSPHSLNKYEELKCEILDPPCVLYLWIKPRKQPTLNKTFWSAPPPPIYRQLKHSKLQKWQT